MTYSDVDVCVAKLLK